MHTTLAWCVITLLMNPYKQQTAHGHLCVMADGHHENVFMAPLVQYDSIPLILESLLKERNPPLWLILVLDPSSL